MIKITCGVGYGDFLGSKTFQENSSKTLLAIKFFSRSIFVASLLYLQCVLILWAFSKLPSSLTKNLVILKFDNLQKNNLPEMELPIFFVFFSLCFEGYILYLDKKSFAENRDRFFQLAQKSFMEDFSTRFSDYNSFAERFLNHYVEHITLGVSQLVNKQSWFFAFFAGTLSCMIIFSVHNQKKLIEKIKKMQTDPLFFFTGGLCFLVALYLCVPAFFLIHFMKSVNFYKKMNLSLRPKVFSQIENGNVLTLNFKKCIDSSVLEAFSLSLNSLKQMFFFLFLGLLGFFIFVYYSTNNEGSGDSSRSLEFFGDDISQFLPIIVLLFFNLSFFNSLTTPDPHKVCNSICKDEIFNSIPRIPAKKNLNEDFPEILYLPLTTEKKHQSGKFVGKNMGFLGVKHREKYVLISPELGSASKKALLENLSNLYGNTPGYSSIKEEKIINYLGKVCLINFDLNFKAKTILENFKEISPIKEDLLNAHLHEVFLKLKEDTVFQEGFSQKIKAKLLFALALSIENYDVIIIDGSLFNFLNQQEKEKIINYLYIMNKAVIIVLDKDQSLEGFLLFSKLIIEQGKLTHLH